MQRRQVESWRRLKIGAGSTLLKSSLILPTACDAGRFPVSRVRNLLELAMQQVFQNSGLLIPLGSGADDRGQ